MTDWNVDQALDQTESNIREGANFIIKKCALIELRENICGNYLNQKSSGAEWADDDDWVLTLARMVGAVASFLALENSLDEIGVAELEAAIRVVATKVCPMARGGYCDYYSNVASLSGSDKQNYLDGLRLMGYGTRNSGQAMGS